MKYIVCNLKNYLNDDNVNNYIKEINNIKYNNIIFCPSNKYINMFKGSYKVGTQDYYDNVTKEYAIIGHHRLNNTKEEIKEKLILANSKNIKIILCIGNNDLSDIKSLKDQLNYYLKDIKIKNDILVAYEPIFMIGSNNVIDIDKLKLCIEEIQNNYNIKVLYGGNVNLNNIKKIINICDGVLVARMSYNSHLFTKILKNLINNI